MNHSHKAIAAFVTALCLASTALPPGPARASPLSGGTLKVTQDIPDGVSVGDSTLSLREAIRIANGSLGGPFSAVEQALMSGCAFDGGGNITGGCGAGNDTIVFTPTLSSVYLISDLPYITATGLTIDGAVNTGHIIISGASGMNYGLVVYANDVTIRNVSIVNIPGNAAIWLAFAKRFELKNSEIGAPPGASNCSFPSVALKPNRGVMIEGTGASDAVSAYLAGNVIGCARDAGVLVYNTGHVQIGVDHTGSSSRNWIGESAGGVPLPNTNTGVRISAAPGTPTYGFQVLTNTISHASSGKGIDLAGIVDVLISGNDISANSSGGIGVSPATSTTLRDNDIHDNGGPGVAFSGSFFQAISNTVVGGRISTNSGAGIIEYPGARNNAWRRLSTYDNGGLGIDKDALGAPDNVGGLVITSVVRLGNTITVSGKLTSATAGHTYAIDVYRADPDPSSYGEGRHFLGTVNVDYNAGGETTWVYANPLELGGCYTGVLSEFDLDGLSNPVSPKSYEFALNVCVSGPILVFMPYSMR